MTTDGNNFTMIYIIFFCAIMVQLSFTIYKFTIVDLCYLIILIVDFVRYLFVKKDLI